MSAETVFNDKLNVLEAVLSRPIKGDTAAERFKALHLLTRDPKLSHQVELYVKFLKESLFSACRSGLTQDSATDIKGYVIDHIFTALVQGMSHIFPANNSPKTHHWMPVTYIRPFGVKGNGKVRALLDGVSFVDNNVVDIVVKDVQFAHDRGEGYDLAVEAFFGQIEDSYANYRERQHLDIFTIAMASFFVSQSVRNPHPQHGFIAKDIVSVINALIVNLDSMDSMFGQSSEVKYKLPISPYTPIRVRRLVDGNRVFVLPILPNVGFALSDKPLPQVDAYNSVNDYRIKLVSSARKNNGIVFGMSSGAVMRTLEQVEKA